MHDIFYFTDIHGMYDLYRAIMDWCNEQDPEATIIFGGDACDRGDRGYEIMKELLNNPKVVYLKGNHEDIFCKAAREIKKKFNFKNPTSKNVRQKLNHTLTYDDDYMAIQLSIVNGGLKTLADWVIDGMPMELIEKIEHLPLTFSTYTCDFCHAAGTYDVFAAGANAEYNEKKVNEDIANNLIWNRSDLSEGWTQGRVAIFGHTPIPYVCEELKKIWPKDEEITPILYSKDKVSGWKLAMDTGAPFLGISYVLNVLTMEAHGFKDTDIKNNEIHQHHIEKIDVIQF